MAAEETLLEAKKAIDDALDVVKEKDIAVEIAAKDVVKSYLVKLTFTLGSKLPKIGVDEDDIIVRCGPPLTRYKGQHVDVLRKWRCCISVDEKV